jgi:hypothetical protein
MEAERGWGIREESATIMEPFQIIGILAIFGLIVALVVMRKKDGAGAKTTTTKSSSSTRI